MNFIITDKIRITTPICRFSFPKLVEPETKFDPAGQYKVMGVMAPDVASEIADRLDALLNLHKGSLKQQAPTQSFKLADLPFGFEEIDGQPSFVVKTKMKASGMERDGRHWSAAPALFDAKGQPIRDRESLKGMWSGTTGRIGFDACPFYNAAIGAGITLRLRAVQIVDLVESGGNAASFGFGEEEGFTVGEASAPIPFDATGSVTDAGDF
jgi:hypothetical protein